MQEKDLRVLFLAKFAPNAGENWSVGIEKIRWIIKAHRKARKGYLRDLPVDA